MKNKAVAIEPVREMTENRANRCQFTGRFVAWLASNRARCIGSLILLIACVGCGSGGGYNPNNVTVTVTPATGTASENSQVTFQATVNGLCSTCSPSIYLWYIYENDPANGGLCTNSPPIPQCPAGTIQETGPSNLTATYNAPSTAGTYHVIAEWAVAWNTTVTKTGTSVITVNP